MKFTPSGARESLGPLQLIGVPVADQGAATETRPDGSMASAS